MSTKNATLVELNEVWKEYKLGAMELAVLRGVSLMIERGSFTAILGQSGSGKSTLLNIIGMLDVPTKGSVFFEGKDTSRISEDNLASIRGKRVGFVFQQFNLLPQLNALENAMIPAVFQGMPENRRIERAQNLLSSVGLKDRMLHRPSELSGGEQQRVAIARALINDPALIVADEPTGNTDSKTGKMIMDMLADLNKTEKRTIIMVTHQTEYTTYADRVVRIRDGELVDN